jgi:hypothetical protein
VDRIGLAGVRPFRLATPRRMGARSPTPGAMLEQRNEQVPTEGVFIDVQKGPLASRKDSPVALLKKSKNDSDHEPS